MQSTSADRIEAACRHIHAAFREGEIGISALAAVAGLGKRQFTTLFTRRYGTTPAQYIIELRLKTALGAVAKDFDFIVIDCPPSLSLLTVNALTASDSVIIPIQCEYYALEGVASLIQTIQRVKKTFNPRLDIEGVLLTMLDGRTNLGLQVVDEVKKHFKKQVYATVIPRTVRLGEAPSHGEPIHIYDKRSTGTTAYAALAQEVLSRNKVKVDKNWKL